MLKTLIKKQLYELFQTYFVNRKTGKTRTKGNTIVLFVLFAALMVGLAFAFFGMASGLGFAVLNKEMNWLFFAIMSLLAMVLGVFGSVFNTYAMLYLPKDNELLLSLPIPPSKLLLSRVFGVYVTSFMYSAWVWIPSMIAYWIQVPVTAANIIFPIVLMFIVALFVSILSCVLGFFVALIAKLSKGKSIITVIMSLAFIALYYFVYFKVMNSIEEIVAHIDEIGSTIKSWLYYVYLIGSGADGEVIPFLIVAGITVALFAVCMFILSKTLLKLATPKDNSSKKIKIDSDYSRRSVDIALLKREFKHFTSVSTWMLNGALGLVIIVAGTVAVIIKGDYIYGLFETACASYPPITQAAPALITVFLCMILSMNTLLAVSVSIEGKHIWLVQSLPVSPWKILQAKERMCILMCTFPGLFFIITGGIVCRLPVWIILMMVCAVIIFIMLLSDFELFLDLKNPHMNWQNEAVLTKQSMSVLINLLVGWGFCATVGVVGFFLSEIVNRAIILAVYIVIFAVLWFILHNWLKKKGSKILESI